MAQIDIETESGLLSSVVVLQKRITNETDCQPNHEYKPQIESDLPSTASCAVSRYDVWLCLCCVMVMFCGVDHWIARSRGVPQKSSPRNTHVHRDPVRDKERREERVWTTTVVSCRVHSTAVCSATPLTLATSDLSVRWLDKSEWQ